MLDVSLLYVDLLVDSFISVYLDGIDKFKFDTHRPIHFSATSSYVSIGFPTFSITISIIMVVVRLISGRKRAVALSILPSFSSSPCFILSMCNHAISCRICMTWLSRSLLYINIQRSL